VTITGRDPFSRSGEDPRQEPQRACDTGDPGVLVEGHQHARAGGVSGGNGRRRSRERAPRCHDLGVERIAELDSARLPVTDRGAGNAVVLLHAGVTDRRSWDGVSDYLCDAGWRSVTYDRRGFGAASAAPASHSPTEDLFSVLDVCCIDRAVLVGNSQGARIAVEAALLRPDRVVGLVLVGASVSGAPRPDEAERRPLLELEAAIEAAEAADDLDSVNELEARLWLDGPTAPPGRVTGAVRELFLAMNGAALRAGDVGESRWCADSWDQLERIAAPTLVVVGELDLPHIVERSRRISELVRGAHFLALHGRAHLPALEDPRAFVTAVFPFLSGLRH
jgi:pimeloyl-ACP methyl ester carboxylesterase